MKPSKCITFVFIAAFIAVMLPCGVSAQGLEGLAHGDHQPKAEDAVEEVTADTTPEKLEPASGKAQEAVEKPSVDQSYVLGADDVIKVTVYGEGDLSSTYKIGSMGMISFPLIGEIDVSRKTTQQVEALLEEKLSNGYLVNPNVSIEVATYRPFYILGEVRNPGSYDFTNGATVLKAVALAGGFTYRANKKEVQVLKTKDSGSDLYDKVSVGTPIGPGDIILVKERFF